MSTIDDVIAGKLRASAAKADERVSKRSGYATTPIGDCLNKLLSTGSASFGWRESCGKTDPTMRTAREWFKIVAALKRKGVAVTETNVKHGNSWATKAGGFWSERVYSLPPAKGAAC